MNNSLKNRLKAAAAEKGLSIRSFEAACGLKRANISSMAEDGALGSDKLAKIVATFPDIDLYWLVLGHSLSDLQAKNSSQSDNGSVALAGSTNTGNITTSCDLGIDYKERCALLERIIKEKETIIQEKERLIQLLLNKLN